MKKIGLLIGMIGICLFMVNSVLAQEEEIIDIVTGKVSSVDLNANKLVITDTEGATQEFVLDPNLTTVWDDVADEEMDLSDLEEGKEVVVEYRVNEAGDKEATWIDIVAPEGEIIPSIPEEESLEETPTE